MFAPDEFIEKVRFTYGRTVHEILAKEPEHHFHDILGAIQTLVGSKLHKGLATSQAERVIFAFTWMAAEVSNGGFHQYFFNSAGDFWRDVLYGLIAIQDEHGLALFQQVLSIFPDSCPSEERFARQKELRELDEEGGDRMWQHFNDVTRRYFASPFPKWELVFDYVKRHREEFDLKDA